MSEDKLGSSTNTVKIRQGLNNVCATARKVFIFNESVHSQLYFHNTSIVI